MFSIQVFNLEQGTIDKSLYATILTGQASIQKCVPYERERSRKTIVHGRLVHNGYCWSAGAAQPAINSGNKLRPLQTRKYCWTTDQYWELFTLSFVSAVRISFIAISYPPDIDMGQIEGAVIMGLGMLLKEQTKYDPETGELLTHNTWVSFLQVLTHV